MKTPKEYAEVAKAKVKRRGLVLWNDDDDAAAILDDLGELFTQAMNEARDKALEEAAALARGAVFHGKEGTSYDVAEAILALRGK